MCQCGSDPVVDIDVVGDVTEMFCTGGVLAKHRGD